MAQTTYEEYLANLMGNINPQGGMVTGQPAPQPQMVMPDISALQQALQGVQSVNQNYVAPELTDLGLFRTQFEEGRRQAVEEVLAQALGVSPAGGLFSGDGESAGISPEQAAYFDVQNEAERDLAMLQFQKALTPLAVQAVLGKSAPVLSGKTNYNIRSREVLEALARGKLDYDKAMAAQGIGWDPAAYGGAGGYVNAEGNAPGASPGEVGNASFGGEVGYDQ